jgi:hypothetical protein
MINKITKNDILQRGIGLGWEEIHLRIERFKKGMKEGIDFEFNTACNNGAYNIRYTNDKSLVTCKKCLSRIKH